MTLATALNGRREDSCTVVVVTPDGGPARGPWCWGRSRRREASVIEWNSPLSRMLVHHHDRLPLDSSNPPPASPASGLVAEAGAKVVVGRMQARLDNELIDHEA